VIRFIEKLIEFKVMEAPLKVDHAIKHNKTSCDVLKLPDNILLHIFSYMDSMSLVYVSKACRKWYEVSCDKSLTQTIDICSHPLTLKQLWKISHRKLCKNTVSIHFKGKMSPTKIMEKITEAYFLDLLKRCPKLCRLSLQCFDLRELPLTLFPVHLEYLSLLESMLSMDWFVCLKTNFSLPLLKHIELEKCTKISNSDLESLSYLKNLEVLNLRNCYRISARSIPCLTKNLSSLNSMDLSCCPAVNDVVMHYLSTLNLINLKLRYCHLITNYGIQQLFSKNMGNSLKKLDLFSCHEISDGSLDVIYEHTLCLMFLDLGECHKLTKVRVNQLKLSLNNCQINFNITKHDTSTECLNQLDATVCSRIR